MDDLLRVQMETHVSASDDSLCEGEERRGEAGPPEQCASCGHSPRSRSRSARLVRRDSGTFHWTTSGHVTYTRGDGGVACISPDMTPETVREAVRAASPRKTSCH